MRHANFGTGRRSEFSSRQREVLKEKRMVLMCIAFFARERGMAGGVVYQDVSNEKTCSPHGTLLALSTYVGEKNTTVENFCLYLCVIPSTMIPSLIAVQYR